MKRVTLSLSLLAAALLALPLLNAPAAGEEKKAAGDEKWVPLFNGKDLTGWKIHPNPNPGAIKQIVEKKNEDGKVIAYEAELKKDGKTVPVWRVEGGMLIGSGPATHLFSARDDYVNFRYRVEAKVNDKGNSGQYFRTQFGPGFPKGYEAQINSTHGDPVKTGSLYNFVKITDKLHKPDEFFTQEVIAVGNHIIIKVNGKTTVDFEDKKNTYTKGHFALQGHDPGTVVTFKKVEVIELPATKTE